MKGGGDLLHAGLGLFSCGREGPVFASRPEDFSPDLTMKLRSVCCKFVLYPALDRDLVDCPLLLRAYLCPSHIPSCLWVVSAMLVGPRVPEYRVRVSWPPGGRGLLPLQNASEPRQDLLWF